MCAVGVSSWRKVSAAVLYAVVEIPLFREIIQKYKRVKSLFFDRRKGETPPLHISVYEDRTFL